MSQIKKFIDEVGRQLPDLCSVKDLVDAKLFSSPFEARARRKRGQLPEFLCLSKRRIIYPKDSVIAWLRSQAEKEGSHDSN